MTKIKARKYVRDLVYEFSLHKFRNSSNEAPASHITFSKMLKNTVQSEGRRALHTNRCHMEKYNIETVKNQIRENVTPKKLKPQETTMSIKLQLQVL